MTCHSSITPNKEDISYRPQPEERHLTLPNRNCYYFTKVGEKDFLPVQPMETPQLSQLKAGLI